MTDAMNEILRRVGSSFGLSDDDKEESKQGIPPNQVGLNLRVSRLGGL